MEQESKKKLLLHSCCGPCSTTAIFTMKDLYDITICYYNPNIYPEEEYLKRKAEQIKLINAVNSEGANIKILDVEYDCNRYEQLVENLHDEPEGGKRCTVCFTMRLTKTAELAKKNGYDMFATTLTVSPHKNAKLINEIGNSISQLYNIAYLETDLKKKDGYKKSIEYSRQYSLYRQNYCGCQYSIYDSTRSNRK